ncbi:MAG: hypothetical protein MZU95_02205 [Desulfomicrobium escambiense]|nr:hypothetical protein [Desulfomicrobium escambiense]
MGGWIQYSLGPTVSAWLAHHFWLHWRYSADRDFLEERAYPYIKGVAVFLDNLSVRRPDGKRQAPAELEPRDQRQPDRRLVSGDDELRPGPRPLALRRRGGHGRRARARRRSRDGGSTILGEWPDLALAEDDGRLLVAPGYPLKGSHRHFSHLMAIHPLGLVDRSGGEADARTIRGALAELDRLGPDWWCGYSYSWLGNLAARAGDGEKAAGALRTFADCFCLPNSFHANGDQTKSGKSKMTYRPFTLEGNFAFAAGIQEMLLQSHAGVIRVFPAVPAAWTDVAFGSLRAEGAFLVSAAMKRGKVVEVRIVSEKGGLLRLEDPFPGGAFKASGNAAGTVRALDGVIEADFLPGQEIRIIGI